MLTVLTSEGLQLPCFVFSLTYPFSIFYWVLDCFYEKTRQLKTQQAFFTIIWCFKDYTNTWLNEKKLGAQATTKQIIWKPHPPALRLLYGWTPVCSGYMNSSKWQVGTACLVPDLCQPPLAFLHHPLMPNLLLSSIAHKTPDAD